MTSLKIDQLELYTKLSLESPSSYSHFELYYLLDDNNLFHHEILPSLIITFPKEEIRFEYYYSHGILYREAGPAFTGSVKEKGLYQRRKNLVMKKIIVI